MNKNQFVKSILIGAYTAVIFLVVITIAGELYKTVNEAGTVVNPIKDFLKNLHGHHWVGKGIWAVALFFLTSGVSYLISKGRVGIAPTGHVKALTWALALGTLVIYGFFAYEYSIH
jgi:hypothetical protein